MVQITDNLKTVIGEGGFGKVYLGILKDETQVAVKLLSTSSKQGYKEFRAEVRHIYIYIWVQDSLYNYVKFHLVLEVEQDLGTILKCCSLSSSHKILSCGFFLIDGIVFFKLSSHMTES